MSEIEFGDDYFDKFDSNFDIKTIQSNNTRVIFLKTGEIIVTCNYDNLQNLDNLNWN